MTMTMTMTATPSGHVPPGIRFADTETTAAILAQIGSAPESNLPLWILRIINAWPLSDPSRIEEYSRALHLAVEPDHSGPDGLTIGWAIVDTPKVHGHTVIIAHGILVPDSGGQYTSHATATGGKHTNRPAGA